MEAKIKEERYVVPENIARDLKNEFGIDYSRREQIPKKKTIQIKK